MTSRDSCACTVKKIGIRWTEVDVLPEDAWPIGSPTVLTQDRPLSRYDLLQPESEVYSDHDNVTIIIVSTSEFECRQRYERMYDEVRIEHSVNPGEYD